MVLRRFFNDMELVGTEISQKGKAIDFSKQAIVPFESQSVFGLENKNKGQVLLEEYVFDVEVEQVAEGAFSQFLKGLTMYLPLEESAKELLQKHAIIVSDDAFSDFV